MIVASIKAATTAEAAAKLKRAKELGVQIAEVRVDFIRDLDLETLLRDKPLPVIIANRPKWEGGAYEGDESTRIMILEEAGKLGAEYIDLEFKAYKDLQDCPAKKIVSYHDFNGTPANIEWIAAKIDALNPAVAKIACVAMSTADLLALVSAGRRIHTLKTIVGMGEFGEPLRVLYGKLGYFITYAALDEPTAPGQPSFEELRELYRADSVDDSWTALAVVGNPVAHSKGPRLWNPILSLGVYARIPVDDVAHLRALMEAFDLRGASVTVPHKEAVIPLLDEVDPVARKIGAVNTIVRDGGRLYGYNTDWLGALAAIKELLARPLFGVKALVFGAGGTARAAVHALVNAGADVFVWNRTFEKAEALTQALGGTPVREPLRDAGLIINTTSVGMNSDESIVPQECLHSGAVCFDVVYSPRETRFLRDARERGSKVITGDRMFINQAIEQWRYFFREDPPKEAFNSAWTKIF